MKYDRPVWQIMHACADDLPKVFRLTEVRVWFAEHYPEVGDATIRAHLVGLTEGGEKHPQFQRRSPVFRRVARGEYTPIPFAERGELPQDAPEEGPLGAEATDKAERKRRKAAKREAKRLAQIEVERQRRALEIERDLREFDDGEPVQPMVETPRADEKLAEDRRSWQRELEAEQGRLIAARDESERAEEQARRDRVAAHAEIEVERRRLAAERAELAQTAAERAEAGRVVQAEIEAERRRLDGERTRTHTSDLHVEDIRAEAERAAARREAERRISERLEAERVADDERRRTRRLRKAARHDREEAEALQRESVQHIARREAERRAHEAIELHLREAADRRRAEDDDRRRTALTVREELARLDRGALDLERLRGAHAPAPLDRDQLAREEHEREQAERDRAQAERDRAQAERQRERAEHDRVERERADRDAREFERAEAERLEFERRDRERVEQQRLAEEAEQLHMTLRPMIDDDPIDDEPPAPATDPDPSESWLDALDPTIGDAPTGTPGSHGGMVIIRAPRPDGPEAFEPPTRDETSTMAPDDLTESGAYDPSDLSIGAVADVVIVGSLGERLAVPAPARDAFRDREFQLVRHGCESLGQRWFVLSADHGLLDPMEWVSPEERGMADLDAAHHAVWASWVVARLESLVGPLAELHVEVTAPEQVAAPVRTALFDAGAVVTAGPTWIGIDDESEVMADLHPRDLHPQDTRPEGPAEPAEPVEAVAQPPAVVEGGEVIPFQRSFSVADHLADQREAVPASAAADLPDLPGLYAWSVDHEGSRLLNRALMLPVRAGVIFVGEVGGGSRFSDSHFSLNEHVTRVQLHGRTRASTFRMTLATALSEVLGLRTIEDPRLTQWMLDHLSVSVWATEDVEGLVALNASVIDELHPALNVDRAPALEYRDRLAQLRRRLA